MNGISPQLQNQIAQLQQLQQQLQAVAGQRIQMEAQGREMGRTLEELAKSTGGVYRNVGSLMVKVDDKDALRKEIEEAAETMEVRVKSIERQEKALREKYEALQTSVNKAMGQE